MSNTGNAIVQMCALVPTKGHKFLIDFALEVSRDMVHVIICSMDEEPVPGEDRVYSFSRTYRHDPRVIFHHCKRDVPQNPSDHPDFWGLWRDIVNEFVDVQPTDMYVSSESYGIDMAKALGCRFVPCNQYRDVFDISGTAVRADILCNFAHILPEFQPLIRKTVTIFGAESCGKTTMAKRLAKEMNGQFVPEWAREYLETVDKQINSQTMSAIVEGQNALQQTIRHTSVDKPWIFHDTDLLSTLGYYNIWKGGTPDEVDAVRRLVMWSYSDLYIVMNDQIPFEQDEIRYGGDKRESNMQFWIDLLTTHGRDFIVVPYGDHEQQTAWCIDQLQKYHKAQHAPIINYKRK